MTKPYRWAVVFGKFMPPHIGHEYLISLADGLAEQTSVFVAHPFHPNPEMPSTLRAQWLQDHFGPAIEFHCPPEGNRNEITTAEAIRRGRAYFDELRGDRMPDIIVGADLHTRFFARLMGVRAVIPDTILTRATRIREKPLAHWDQILPPARPFFLREAIFIATASQRRKIARKAKQHGVLHLPIANLPPEQVAASLAAARKVARRGLVVSLDPDQVDETLLDKLAVGPHGPENRMVYAFGGGEVSHPTLRVVDDPGFNDTYIEGIIDSLRSDR